MEKIPVQKSGASDTIAELKARETREPIASFSMFDYPTKLSLQLD